MSNEDRFTRKGANSTFRSYALLLIIICSLGLVGCSGLVTASSPGGGTQNPLSVSGVQALAPTTSSFQVDWSTNIAANSAVDYGTSASYGSSTPVNSSMVTSHQVALSGLAIGTLYHFRVRSTDANNVTATSGDVTFSTAGDTIPPTVSITSPAANATLSGNVNVDVTATDNVAVQNVQLKIDNANYGAAVTSAPYVIPVNTGTLSNGNHILTAVATDTSNNSATSSAVAVKVNNAAAIPSIASLSPTSGVVGTSVTIGGANFGATQGTSTVTFGGVAAAATSWSATSIVAPVPAAATTGNVVVTVGGAASNGLSFTVPVPSPSITSLNPTSGAVGTSVTISGANFGAAQGSSTVKFNGTTATASSWSATSIVAPVPVGATTGNVVVTVGGAASNGVSFTLQADTTPPTVPTGLTASAISSSQINLSWTASTDNVGVTGYNIYRGGSKIGTTPSTTYQDTGLAASTSYTYNVSAFDAAGNTSAQSSTASTTTLASSGGGIPSSLGWFQIPNTQMQNVCPSGYNCANVIVPWSGGIGDTSRNRLIVWGGGHSDYGGNEVYALDLNALTINRLNNPSPPASSCVEVLSDGTPPSRHTYDDLAYIAHADRMFSYTGSMAPTGCGSLATWTLTMSNLQWQDMNPSGTAPTPNGGLAAADYDPNTKNVFVHTVSWGMFASYNFDTNTMKLLASNEIINYYVTAVVDPKRRLFFMFGANGAYKIDISGNDPSYSLKTLAASGCTFQNIDAPGAAYDSVQDRIVGWSGGNSVNIYNADTDSCTTVTYANGPGAQQTLGTYGRFRYFPALGVFALVNSASQNAYTLRLTAPTGGSGPVISGVGATSITTSGATINWTTDVGTTSQVEYGPTTAYGTLTALNSTLVTAHSIALSGLSANTSYHYRVHSKNSSGVETISGDLSFQTNGTTDTTPPTVNITAPAAGATVSGTVSVTATATDNVSVSSVQFLLDGVPLGAPLTAGPYSVSWNTTTASNGAHTLGASATDPSANVGNAVGVSVSVSNATDAALADFQARCAALGVLRCEGWDNAADFTPAGGGGYASGLYPAEDGTYQGIQDTSLKVSGAGSLKFNIRAGSVSPLGTNPSGLWKANFGPDNNITRFGPHTTLYIQFRLRLDPNMINYDWTKVSGQGWKVFIAFGPIPGTSCTGAQFVQENTNQTNVATGYTSCGTPSLDTNNGVPPMLIEQGDYNCPYTSSGGYSSNPNCFAYPVNTWMTEYWVVSVGDYGQPNTSFTAYIAPDGQPLKKFIDLPNFTFNSGASAGDALMEIILQPYFSGATNATISPASAMWFDELIISTQPIAAPKF
jgi:hypothetical protein